MYLIFYIIHHSDKAVLCLRDLIYQNNHILSDLLAQSILTIVKNYIPVFDLIPI